MKKWSIPILIALVMLAGCIKPEAAKQPPIAYIDSVTPAEAYIGEKVTFVGHGAAMGEIVAYRWRSSISGELSTLATFGTSSLTAGTHTIWLKVQDDAGNWSPEVSVNINILAISGPAKPIVKIFNADPSNIISGESSTLTWEVIDASTVKIDPNVGNVALSGSREVFPSVDTMYTLTATNEAGTVYTTTKVMTTAASALHVLTLHSMAAEDGSVTRDGTIDQEPNVGQNVSQVPMQAFLSFDISSLPPGAIIKFVSLDLSGSSIIGQPFPYLGALQFYNQQYGTVKSSTYTSSSTAGYLYSYNIIYGRTLPPDPVTSGLFVQTVQKQIDAGSSRYQIRVQFEKQYYYTVDPYVVAGGQSRPAANYLNLGEGKPKLVIKYQE